MFGLLYDNIARFLSSGVALVILAACGSSGSGSGSIPIPLPPTTTPSQSSWQQGVFEPASTFQAKCQTPRIGVNPATNQSFPDVHGTSTDENNFLRSYSDDTYLWYDEIIDQDPGFYSDPLLYFDQLKTFAVTQTGREKDKYHFTYDSEDYYRLSQSGVSSGYGMQVVLLSAVPPRETVVAYTEPNSPATSALVNLARGARILTIDGVDININTQHGVDILNAGLFPSSVGETHTFRVRDLGSTGSRNITMTSAAITSMPVRDTQVIVRPNGDRVGYMVFNDHIATAEQALIDAVNLLNAGPGIDDLVLDMRYNGGGYLAIASELAYMIAGPAATANRTFELLQFNDKHLTVNPITGHSVSPVPFYSNALGPPFNAVPDQPLPTLDLSRVFVITGTGTCSASEAVMNGLRGIGIEVIQIGSTTCGKPYGFYPVDNCGTTYFTIQFRGVNDQNFGDYTDGFSPANTHTDTGILGCAVGDDFGAALGDPAERRLAVALNYRDVRTCSTSSRGAAAVVNTTDGILPKPVWQMNRIMLPWPEN